MTKRQKLDGQESFLTLKVVLQCTKTEEVEEKVITFESFPATILDIKKQIEKQHSVPGCVQEISYDGHKVNDNVKLSTMKVRNGDTFHIKYLAKGHCSEITDTLKWLNSLLAKIETSKDSEIESLVLLGIISTTVGDGILRDLAFKYFYPWCDSNSYVNKLLFAYHGGIEILIKVYEVILQVKCQGPFYVRLKSTEVAILSVLWNFSETFPFKQLVIQNKGIQMCTQSMLRVRLEEGKSIEEIAPQYTHNEQSILLETIRGAAGVLCVLSEVPECHMEIASNKDILHQMTCLSILNGVHSHPQIVAISFVCLASTPGTHKHLSNPIFVRRFLDSCEMCQSEEVRLLLKYLTLLFLAQVALATPHCVPQDYRQKIISDMRLFMQTTRYQTILDTQIKHGYAWCTLLPYIKLAYIPSASKTAFQLQLKSLQLIIFNLQNLLSRADHREILLKEGLLDYVMCLSQYVPASLRSQAEELVRMVGSAPDIPEGPPKLLNLVKARLAKMHFGLEQVLSLSVSEIVSKVLLI